MPNKTVYPSWRPRGLRDEFAMAALAFITVAYPKDKGIYPNTVARLAYEIADEMLMVREEK